MRTTILTLALILSACGGGAAETSTRCGPGMRCGPPEGARCGPHMRCAGAGGEELPAAPTIAGPDARARVEAGALLLDVTPNDRRAESEIEGSTHIPLDELRDRMSELPRDRPIVVYCLGGGGSPRAGAILQAEGYDVHVLGARRNWDAPAE